MFAIILLFTTVGCEVINYAKEDYVLIENGNAALYQEYGHIFHVTNLSHYEELVEETEEHLYNSYSPITSNNTTDANTIDLNIELSMTKTMLRQLKINVRTKRSINTIGTVWKWLAGTPDYDDLITITNKLNELSTNNNKQFLINSQMFHHINKLSQTIKETLFSSRIDHIIKRRNTLIMSELSNMIQTITLAKANILNTQILNYEEIKEILSKENSTFSLTDLMDTSKFKIVQNKEVIVLHIKYPIIKNICTLYETRAISQGDGKLVIDNQIANCKNKFINVNFCKKELVDTYCKISNQTTCFSNLLNNNIAKCMKVKEKNKEIDIIKDGAILISGEHNVDEVNLKGTYLVLFENFTTIDNNTFENPTAIIWKYLQTFKEKKFDITKYLESDNEELKFNNINIIGMIKNEIRNQPTLWSFNFIAAILVLSFIIIKCCPKVEPKITTVDMFETINSQIQTLTAARLHNLNEETGRFS